MIKSILQRLSKVNLSVQLIAIFVLALFLGPYIDPSYKAIVYTISSIMKEILLFLLPVIIFSCLVHSLMSNQKSALRFVVILLVTVCLSNFVSILFSYFAGVFGLSFVNLAQSTTSNMPELKSLWTLNLPTLISNELSLILGFAAGLLLSFFPNKKAALVAKTINGAVTLFLQKCFVPLLPIFALGFIIKNEYEGILKVVVTTYAPIVILLLIVNLLYILIMFGVAAKFKPKLWMRYFQKSLPAGILGFSTMSSLATMPVTLNIAEQNTQDPKMARTIIPATVNIHLIGDSLSIPILAMAVSLTFGSPLPTLMQYLIFTQFFMLAKFAAPAIPCGTIFVMIPVLEKYFGFTTEMSAFIAAIYILFDSIVTSANVLGNSAFVIMLTRLLKGARHQDAVSTVPGTDDGRNLTIPGSKV